MVKISIDTAIYCQDGYYGQIRYLTINPLTWQLTHLVLQPGGLPVLRSRYLMRLVPVHLLNTTDVQKVCLECTIDAVTRFEPFIQIGYTRSDTSPKEISESHDWIEPSSGEQSVMPIEHYNVPAGEVAMSRETQVEATDGHVGRFDELYFSHERGLSTHIGFRRGHLWEQMIITISTSEISHIETDAIYLKLDKSKVADLQILSKVVGEAAINKAAY